MPVSIDIACRTLAYYDVANLAQKIKVPGFYSYGYNDNTCPPTTVTAALNVITAPKTIVVTPVSAHWRFEETNHPPAGAPPHFQDAFWPETAR